MPHYYLHLSNGAGDVRDEEGADLPGVPAARDRAISGIRSIIAEEVRDGRIDLVGKIVICDINDEALLEVLFSEAFELHLDARYSATGSRAAP